MGRGKHCSENQTETIEKLRREGRKFKEISYFVGCSINMVSSALKHKTRPETRGGKRKTSTKTDGRIIRYVKKNPLVKSSEIKKENNLEINTSKYVDV